MRLTEKNDIVNMMDGFSECIKRMDRFLKNYGGKFIYGCFDTRCVFPNKVVQFCFYRDTDNVDCRFVNIAIDSNNVCDDMMEILATYYMNKSEGNSLICDSVVEKDTFKKLMELTTRYFKSFGADIMDFGIDKCESYGICVVKYDDFITTWRYFKS